MQGLEGTAAGPSAPHVQSFAEAVPVTSARLRKAVAVAPKAQFGGKLGKVSAELEQLRDGVPRGRMVLTLESAGRGWRQVSKRMGYCLWAELDGTKTAPSEP